MKKKCRTHCIILLMTAGLGPPFAVGGEQPAACALEGMSVMEARSREAEVARAANRENRYGLVLALKSLLEGCESSDSPAVDIVRNGLWQWRAEYGYYGEAPYVPEVEGLVLRDAVTAIASEAKNRKVLMMDEAHNVPRHRILTIELLKALREYGYTHFAAETLSTEIRLGADGYPIRDTGVYAREPVAAEMIRTAIDLGYKLVAYEAAFNPSLENWREAGQAANLAKVFEVEPDAKMIVHAGNGHIDESDERKHKMMGALFKKLSGIDPLTVDQSSVRELRSKRREHPSYGAIAARIPGNSPVVVSRGADQSWRPENSWQADMYVVYPRTYYESGRPSWMTLNGARKFVAMPQGVCGSEPECLVAVRRKTDSDASVPVDQIEVTRENPRPAFALPVGEFKGESTTVQGQPVKMFSLEVE